jgi:hypothetical protein
LHKPIRQHLEARTRLCARVAKKSSKAGTFSWLLGALTESHEETGPEPEGSRKTSASSAWSLNLANHHVITIMEQVILRLPKWLNGDSTAFIAKARPHAECGSSLESV